MATNHKLIIGNCMDMSEIPNGNIHLVVTSPPYFNAPFDYKNLFKNYEQYLGVLRKMAKESFRVLAEGRIFVLNIDENASNFEVFSFAIIKVHLEKFACKIYRDTKTSSHDKGTDLSTNFGVVYQIKKLKIDNLSAAKAIYAELKTNFDNERLDDGKIILIIDDISKEIKSYLINMKIQSISKSDVLKLAGQFDDVEDREKILRIIYDEFSREYLSDIK